MAARNIDEVLLDLDDVLSEAIRTDDRIGYFVALYLRVTWAVKRAIIAGDVFDDNERMAHFDTVFANRFLEAWMADDDSEWLTAPWAQAFEALERDDLMVVQHLALGMNAHINLDLGIAAEQVMYERGEPLEALRADFDRINQVLARLTDIVQVQLGQLSATFDKVTELAPELQSMLFGAALDGLRDQAWAFATQLAAAEDDEHRQQLIDERSALIDEAGALILLPADIGVFVGDVAREENQHAVRYNIRILAQ